jgi:WD40 repeat protein
LPDSDLLAVLESNGALRVWSVRIQRPIRTLQPAPRRRAGYPDTTGRAFVTVSRDGSRLAVDAPPRGAGPASGGVRIYDARSWRELRILRGHTGDVVAAQFTADGKTLATGGTDGTVRTWDLTAGGQVRQMDTGGRVAGLAITSDGRLVASSREQGPVSIWDTSTGNAIRVLNGAGPAVAFSLNGALLATGSAAGPITLWDTATWKSVRTLEGHRRPVTAVRFSPDGHAVAATSADNRSLLLWNARTGKVSQIMQGRTPIEFAPDGRSLAAMLDTVLRIWSLSPV